MQDFGTKANDTAGPSGQLSADEFNNLATENENAVLRAGLVLNGTQDTQLAQSAFLHGVKSASFQDSGGANAYVATPISGAGGVLLPTAYAPLAGSIITFKAAATNTGASTLNIGQTTGTLLGTKPIRTQTDTALPAGSISAGQYVQLVYNASFNAGSGAWELLPWAYTDVSQPPSALNTRASIVGPTASTTITANSVTLSTALGGQNFQLTNFSQLINLAIVGAGGMDVGSAPLNGFVAVYAIYNPTTNTRSTVAKNATSAIQTETYTGANMPAGYTFSALLCVLPTTGAGIFKVCAVNNRRVAIQSVQVFSGSTGGLVLQSFSAATAIPFNAIDITGGITNSSTAASNIGLTLSSASTGLSTQNISSTVVAGGAINGNYSMSVIVPQTLYVSTTNTAGTPTYTVSIVEYSI